MTTPRTPPAPCLAGLPDEAWQGCDAALFSQARAAYDTPGRHYHAWSHIEACLALFAQQVFQQPRAVLLALLFHDAVYVPGDKRNEKLSAELAVRLIRRHSRVGTGEQRRIADLIEMTASHHAHAGRVEADPDAAGLIDIDLSVLGAPWSAYQRYADGVRREFCPAVVPQALFNQGRAGFLRGLLAQPAIFATPWMRERREAAARDNVGRELAALEAEGAAVAFNQHPLV